MSEISQEMERDLLNGLYADGARIQEHASWLANIAGPENTPYARSIKIEQLAYITEQMRLKLKILGAPRIYN